MDEMDPRLREALNRAAREQAERIRERARQRTPYTHRPGCSCALCFIRTRGGRRLPAQSYLEGGQLVHVVTTVPRRVPNRDPFARDLAAYRLAQAYAAGRIHMPTPRFDGSVS